MKLYFENTIGKRRIIAEPKTGDDAWNEIQKFCEDRNFKIHYVRSWNDEDGLKVFDVGSHTEFFYLDENN